MAYKYLTAYSSIANITPKQSYIDLFQETLNQQFKNSSDWFTIQEETPFASKSYSNIDVRINHLINAETGIKLGDDWKSILFSNVTHTTQIGMLYNFDNNIWITTNTESIKNLAASATVKRCNEIMRWLDQKTGAIYSEPCSIDYLIKEPRDYATAGSALVTPSGYIQIKVQFNDRTNLIRPNQRFLFGNSKNWTAYKIVGTGVNNLNRLKTNDELSVGIILLEAVANFVNYETDDITNGIADTGQNVYTLSLDQSSISGSIGQIVKLTATVTLNNDIVTVPLTWISSDITKATVNSSGLVTMLANGVANITVNISNSPVNAVSVATISITPTPNKTILIVPNQNFVYEHSTQNFSVYLYINDIVQSDTLTFTCNPNGIPSTNYTFSTVDGNHFSVKNIEKFLTANLKITCTSGSNSKILDIQLKGVW